MRISSVSFASLGVAVVMAGAYANEADAAPPTPMQPRVASVTASSVTLNWTPGYLTGPTRWQVFQNGSLVATRPGSSFTANGLVPGATYAFHIVAVDAAGNTSPPTRTMTVTTRGPGVAPGGPSDLRVTELSPGRIALTWNEPDDIFDVSSYAVFDGDTQVAFAYPTWNDQVTVVHRRVAPGSTHAYTVTALRASGESAPSNVVTATTPSTTDTQAPSAPAGVSVDISRYSCNFVDITWTQSTDGTDPAAAIDYEVVIDGALHDVVRGTGFYGNAFGGGPGESRTYTIHAVDSSGNASGPSNTVTFQIDPFCNEF